MYYVCFELKDNPTDSALLETGERVDADRELDIKVVGQSEDR